MSSAFFISRNSAKLTFFCRYSHAFQGLAVFLWGMIVQSRSWDACCGWLVQSITLIEEAFQKAKLQGPAPNKTRDIIPLVTTFYSSLNHSHAIKTISKLFKGIQDPEARRKCNETKPILALKQPPNLRF